jgi:hypothetical protein
MAWHTVAQLVEVVRYMPEGRGFGYRWCHYGPKFDSVSNRNGYQEYILGSEVADCLEIWVPQPPGTHRACPGT